LEIVCVERKGKKPKHRHITVVGVAVNKTVIRFSVKTIRRIVKEGTVEFYCLDPNGEKIRVRRYKCHCGVKTIRTGSDGVTDGYLSRLPTCGH